MTPHNSTIGQPAKVPPNNRQGDGVPSSRLDAMKSNSSNFSSTITASMAAPMDVFEGHHLYHPYTTDANADDEESGPRHRPLSTSPPPPPMMVHPNEATSTDLLQSPNLQHQHQQQQHFFAPDSSTSRRPLSATNRGSAAGQKRPFRARTLSNPTPTSSRSPLAAFGIYQHLDHPEDGSVMRPSSKDSSSSLHRIGPVVPPPPPSSSFLSVPSRTIRTSPPLLKPRVDVMMDDDSDRAERTRLLMMAGLIAPNNSSNNDMHHPHHLDNGSTATAKRMMMMMMASTTETTPLFSKMQNLQRRDDPDFGLHRSSTSILCGFCCSWLVWISVWIVLFAAIIKRDEWTRIDRLYFASSTFWMVGYGDFVPTTTQERLLTSAYMLLSMCFFGLALGRWGNSVIEAYKAASLAQLYTPSAGSESLRGTNPMGSSSSSNYHSHSLLHPSSYYRNNYSSASNNNIHNAIDGKDFLMFPGLPWLLVQSIFLTALSIFCVYGIQYYEQELDNGEWTAVSTIYYAVSTACTVGLGDVVPTKESGRLLAVFFLPLAVGTTLHWMVWMAQGGIQRMQRNMIHRRDLRLDEFYERKLQSMGLVDAATFRALKSEYEQLS